MGRGKSPKDPFVLLTQKNPLINESLFSIPFQCIAFALATCVLAANLDKDATVVSDTREVNPDGSYNYAYETSNGIAANEAGVGGEQASGSYRWVSPEGEPVEVQYTADENGYQASGPHIPQPPPIPEQIIKALEYIRANPPPPERK